MPKPKHYNPDGRDALGRLYPSLRGRGTCPECRRDDILVNVDGTLRYHYPTPEHPQANCPGSGARAGPGRLAPNEARKQAEGERDEALAAITRVRALHTRSERPVVTTSLCTTHGTRENLLSLRDRAGHDAMRAAAGACPDCSVTEKHVCTHCRAECPDDDEWPCPTIRALEGEQ